MNGASAKEDRLKSKREVALGPTYFICQVVLIYRITAATTSLKDRSDLPPRWDPLPLPPVSIDALKLPNVVDACLTKSLMHTAHFRASRVGRRVPSPVHNPTIVNDADSISSFLCSIPFGLDPPTHIILFREGEN
jgi:hypothetical protein